MFSRIIVYPRMSAYFYMYYMFKTVRNFMVRLSHHIRRHADSDNDSETTKETRETIHARSYSLIIDTRATKRDAMVEI